jgi:hypothetical protein
MAVVEREALYLSAPMKCGLGLSAKRAETVLCGVHRIVLLDSNSKFLFEITSANGRKKFLSVVGSPPSIVFCAPFSIPRSFALLLIAYCLARFTRRMGCSIRWLFASTTKLFFGKESFLRSWHFLSSAEGEQGEQSAVARPTLMQN